MRDSVVCPVIKLAHGADLPLPAYATPLSVGMDLMAAIDGDIVLKPFERTLVPCGLSLALPQGFEAQVRPRSGLALKNGITVLNAPGTIDADYRGEIKVILINLGEEPFTIQRGMRVAQMVVAPYTQMIFHAVEVFEEEIPLQRSIAGFGSTGI